MNDILFAGADANYNYAKYVILGAPLDITGTHRRGSAQAPGAIRNESYTFETFIPEMEIDLKDVAVHDMGNLPMGNNPKQEIFDAISKILADGKIPIMMGGEHSISPYAIEAFSDVSVLVFDAHLDYRDEHLGDRNNHACASRRIDDVISPEKLLPVGIRSICKEEYYDAKKNGLEYITAEQVMDMGKKELIKFIDDLMPGNIYVSVDVDGIDPAFAPGVGTPEPWGLDPIVVRDVIRHLAPRIVGYDIVEICPPVDNGNTSALAAKLIKDFIAAKELAEK